MSAKGRRWRFWAQGRHRAPVRLLGAAIGLIDAERIAPIPRQLAPLRQLLDLIRPGRMRERVAGAITRAAPPWRC